MKNYLNALLDIKNKGIRKSSGRANMPDVIGTSGARIEMDLSEGFPLLTTKRMYWKAIVCELLWFLRGDTNIKYLVDNDVHIWDGDAYRWYCRACDITKQNPVTMPDFIEIIRRGSDLKSLSKEHFNSDEYVFGDLGRVYGYQWRNQNGVDQLDEMLSGLQRNPYSRYHIIDSWNKVDFGIMALPPCHLLYQFTVRPISDFNRKLLLSQKPEWEGQFALIDEDPSGDILDVCDEENVPKFYLDLNMYQRSCDMFLGVPFNLASMSLLLTIISKTVGMIPGVAIWTGADTHIYVDHMPMVDEQLSRDPLTLPKVTINKELTSLKDILALEISDFSLEDYQYYPAIRAELFTGNKK